MKPTLLVLSLLCAFAAAANDATPPTIPDAGGQATGNQGWKIYESSAQSIADTRDAGETQRKQTLADSTATAGFC
jgi:hypothetical protein